MDRNDRCRGSADDGGRLSREEEGKPQVVGANNGVMRTSHSMIQLLQIKVDVGAQVV